MSRTRRLAPPGRVVFLARDGALAPLRVESLVDGRLRARDLAGATHVLRPERLYWASCARASSDDALAAHWAAVQARAPQVDLARAWDARQKAAPNDLGEGASTVAAAALDTDEVTPVDVDALVLAVFADRLYFKVRRRSLERVPPKAVAARRAQREAQAAEAARHAEALAALKALRGAGAPTSARPSPPAAAPGSVVAQALEALRTLALHGLDAPDAGWAGRLLTDLAPVAAPGAPRPTPKRAAFDLLVELGVWGPHEDLGLLRAGLSADFSPELQAHAAQLARSPVPDVALAPAPARDAPTPPPATRQDYTHLYTIAVDAAGTTEVDDAFAIEPPADERVGGARLVVFIADAAAYIQPGDPLRHEAARRATTLYLPQGPIPMLPPTLAEGALSLVAGARRPALALSGRLGAHGTLTDFRVEEAWVRVDRQLTYEQVDATLAVPDREPPPADAPHSAAPPEEAAPPDSALIRQAAAWMEAHQAARVDQGALRFARREVRFDVDDNGVVTRSEGDPGGPGRQLIAEMMIAVCAAVGRLCAARGVPCLYRTQAAPDRPAEVPPGEVIRDPFEQWRVLRRFKPSRLSTTPGSHYSLAVDAYVQVTSPIRRYADLLVQTQLKALARGEAPPLDAQALVAEAAAIEQAAGVGRAVSQQARRYWTLVYLQQRQDAGQAAAWDAVVIRPSGRRWVVQIPALALQDTVVSGRRWRGGERVRLAVDAVDPRSDRLVLREV